MKQTSKKKFMHNITSQDKEIIKKNTKRHLSFSKVKKKKTMFQKTDYKQKGGGRKKRESFTQNMKHKTCFGVSLIFVSKHQN